MNRSVTLGLTMLAGAALLETTLVPGLVIGATAALVPGVLPGLRRRLRPMLGPLSPARPVRRAAPLVAAAPASPWGAVPVQGPAKPSVATRLGVKRALAKTVTFRVIVTALDFTSNYIVIGDLATAAGLSSFALVAGPLFYFAHETAWNYFGAAGERVPVPGLPARGAADDAAPRGFVMSRALAKTITFRTIATAVDFTTTYVVVGDLATAAGLSAFGFVVGPFVYLGHERLWERFGGAAGAAEGPLRLPVPSRLIGSAA